MYQINLIDKTALVTGASAGIGYTIARALLSQGCHVAITGRNPEKLTAARRSLQEEFSGANILAISSDGSKRKEITNMVEQVIREFGHIDILVNNAGTNIPKDALEVTEEEWDYILDINLKGLFFCCQEAGRHMLERKSGKIINISSQMGLVGLYKRAAYCSSKGGVVQLTKVLAIEWAPHNIQVNSVAPTFTETPLANTMLEDKQFYDDVIRRIPMGRLPKPEDIAGAVLFLASDLANFVTGHTLPVDGGWLAW